MTERSGFWDGTSTGDASAAPYSAQEFADLMTSTMGFGAQRPNVGPIKGSNSTSTQYDGLQVTENSPAAASVVLQIGRALVDGFWYENDAAYSLAIAANGSGNPRIDTLVLQKVTASQTVRAVVKQGTPAASPVPPTLTQTGATWEAPIADIAVANGFTSITNDNITSRAEWANVSDAVLHDNIYAVGAQVTGNVVEYNNTGARRMGTGASGFPILNVGGIWQSRRANAEIGRVLARGIGRANTSGTNIVNSFGHLSTSVASALDSTTQPLAISIARFLEAHTGAGSVLADIDARPWAESFGLAAVTTELSIASASLAITGIPSTQDTLVIEIAIRTAVAAGNELVNIRFGDTSTLDTTAANYHSVAAIISGTPVTGANSNIGATAGIQVQAVGNTGTAGGFAYYVLYIQNVLNTGGGFVKHVTGHGWWQSAASAAGSIVSLVGGRWLNTTLTLNQISIISSSAANISAGSYLNVYAKRTRFTAP